MLRDVETDDCAVTALANVTGFSYETCHDALAKAGRRMREGTKPSETRTALAALGYRVTHVWKGGAVSAALGLRSPKMSSVITDPIAWEDHPDALVFAPTHVAAFSKGELKDWSANRDMPIEEIWSVAPIHAPVVAPDVIYL
jgi:hypothetical protein